MSAADVVLLAVGGAFAVGGIAWLVRMHFGRYGGMGVRVTYVIIGLLPAVMFVTGAVMWWNRVLRRWLAETKTSRARSRAVLPVPTAVE